MADRRPGRVRVTALQLAARWADRDAALAKASELLLRAPTDLAVLPEAALTGYVSPQDDFDLTRFGEPLDGPTTEALAALARRAGCFVVGPLIEREGDRVYNASVAFDATGRRVAHYRKRHPWYPETWASAGASPHPTFEVLGAQVTLAICFDIHFVEADARETLEAADLLLFPSAWVEDADSRAEIFARIAQRFGLGIVNANWAAGDVSFYGQGASRIVSPSGRVLATAGEGEERIDADLDI